MNIYFPHIFGLFGCQRHRQTGLWFGGAGENSFFFDNCGQATPYFHTASPPPLGFWDSSRIRGWDSTRTRGASSSASASSRSGSGAWGGSLKAPSISGFTPRGSKLRGWSSSNGGSSGAGTGRFSDMGMGDDRGSFRSFLSRTFLGRLSGGGGSGRGAGGAEGQTIELTSVADCENEIQRLTESS